MESAAQTHFAEQRTRPNDKPRKNVPTATHAGKSSSSQNGSLAKPKHLNAVAAMSCRHLGEVAAPAANAGADHQERPPMPYCRL